MRKSLSFLFNSTSPLERFNKNSFNGCINQSLLFHPLSISQKYTVFSWPYSYSHICVLITLLSFCSNFNEASRGKGDTYECLVCHLELQVHYILQTHFCLQLHVWVFFGILKLPSSYAYFLNVGFP